MQVNQGLSDELFRLFANLGHATHRPGASETSTVTFSLLAALDGAPRRGCELAAALGLDQSTISRRLTSLRDAGLIERLPDPEDGRAHLIRTSPVGRSLVEKERSRRVRTITDTLDGWSDEDRSELSRLLGQLNSTPEAHRGLRQEESRD